MRSPYLSLLEVVESHLLSFQPIDEQPLPEYIDAGSELHATIVETIEAGDPRALDLIAQHRATSAAPAQM